ncbi:hypothetical protein Q8A73_011144 [Channa argus]|nr:hypothetical protein Q8A73_011144 [Channa argus]
MATQAFPSLSAALMMLCRTTAVSSWQVCKWEPQPTALGPYRRNAKNKTEGEETGLIARRRNEYPHKIPLPESWIQYSIENFPSTPGHRHGRHSQYVLNTHFARLGHEDGSGLEIISCSELDRIRSRGKICTEHLLSGLKEINVGMAAVRLSVK